MNIVLHLYESGAVVLPNLHFFDLQVDSNKSATGFTVEDGTVRNDYVVDTPVRITVSAMIVDSVEDTYQRLRGYWADKTLFSIQTRVGLFSKMLLEGMPHQEDTSNFTGIGLSLTFVEWKEVVPEEGSFTITQVAKPEQSDTKPVGQKIPDKAAENKTIYSAETTPFKSRSNPNVN